MSDKQKNTPDLETLKARHLAEAAADLDRRLTAAMELLSPIGWTAVPLGHQTAPVVVPTSEKSSQGFDGTVSDLIDGYKTHPRSSFHGLSFATRENYSYILRPVENEFGSKRVSDLTSGDEIRAVVDKYISTGRRGMAVAFIGSLSRAVTFGDTVFGDRACRELRIVLRDIIPSVPKPEKRDAVLTREMANAIRAEAHRQEYHSLALAQALQFDCDLHQRDVIGNWVPLDEAGFPPSDEIHDGKKWVQGLRWNDIGDDLVLRRIGQKDISLRDKPMVMEELDRIGGRQRSGRAIVVNERTTRPYGQMAFRKTWRRIATACGVPLDVTNADSRSRVEYDGPSRRRKKIAGAAK